MDKREKETPDFMNVESFSKLPFIRPAPLKEKGIRLFGKEFGGVADSDTVLLSDDSDSVETNTLKEVKETETGESDRKFECHYCFRKFPTSQALGGHQNAHKRERQHAKRASMAHDFYPQAHAFRMNYHRFGSSSVNYSPGVTPHQYTKNINSKFYDRFYGGYGSYIQPQPPFIHGSPMAMWRIPSTHNVPRFTHDQHLARNSLPSYANIDAVQPSRNGSTTSQSEYAYQSKSLKDHISLDLHL